MARALRSPCTGALHGKPQDDLPQALRQSALEFRPWHRVDRRARKAGACVRLCKCGRRCVAPSAVPGACRSLRRARHPPAIGVAVGHRRARLLCKHHRHPYVVMLQHAPHKACKQHKTAAALHKSCGRTFARTNSAEPRGPGGHGERQRRAARPLRAHRRRRPPGPLCTPFGRGSGALCAGGRCSGMASLSF